MEHGHRIGSFALVDLGAMVEFTDVRHSGKRSATAECSPRTMSGRWNAALSLGSRSFHAKGSSMFLALWHALVVAAGMVWEVGWSLVFGFVLSGVVQAVVSKERMQHALGRDGVREIALATAYGAASSSCSYASAALSKTLFKKGAAFIPSLAFLFSSTNLVIELGLVLYFL